MSNLSPAKAGSKNHLGRVSWGSLRSPQALRCRLLRRLLNLAPHENKLGKNLPKGSLEEMKYSPKIFALFLIALFACHIEAKSWHGITPLKSNRNDVARVLNQSVAPDAETSKYDSETEQVRFLFSRPGGYWGDCEKLIPPGTVLTIEVIPKVPRHLSDLQTDTNKFQKLVPSGEFLIDGDAFSDETEGLVVSTKDGFVRRIVYLPAKHDQYPCRAYYQEPRYFVDRIICMLCPTINVASADTAEAGSLTTFTVNVGGAATPLTYTWSVSEGKIVEGQGTELIKVDTKGVKDWVVVATVEVGGIDSACARTASSTTAVIPRRN